MVKNNGNPDLVCENYLAHMVWFQNCKYRPAGFDSGSVWFIEVHQIKFLGYGRYNMPHVNNVIFSESKFALLFQHTKVNNFWKQKHINKRMEHSQ